MDRRTTAPEESGFLKDLKNEAEEEEYDDKIEYNGKTYRVPYKMVKEVVFSNLSSAELKDIPYSARLQYRLLLMDSVIRAKVEFIRNRITITYNPTESKNRKPKVSREELIAFLAKEGVNVNMNSISERDQDYVKEIYTYQFEPAAIREHAPYGYTIQEWKKMKPEWQKKQIEQNQAKYEKFQRWQDSYLEKRPELQKTGVTPNNLPEKVSLLGKLMGKGKKKNEKEKGFWFHGV